MSKPVINQAYGPAFACTQSRENPGRHLAITSLPGINNRVPRRLNFLSKSTYPYIGNFAYRKSEEKR
jgi:hypothetical protein